MMPDALPIKELSVREVEIQIAVTNNRFKRVYKNQTVTIAEFAKLLATPAVGHETQAQYLHMPKSQQDDLKDHGGFVGGVLKGGVRNSRSVANRSCVTLDLDNAGDNSLETVLAAIEAATPGAAYIVHSTRKHRAECVRLRVVIFVSRPVYPDEYQAIARKLASLSNIEWFDDTTYDPSRIMYWPSKSRDADYVFIDTTDRADVGLADADALLALYGPDDAWKDATLWPTSSRQQTVIQKELRNQQNPLEKKGIVGAFCRVFDIHGAIKEFLSDVYRRDGGRYTFVEGSTAKGVALYGTEEGGKALWAYSNHATDPASGVLCNAFDLVRLHLFGHLDEKKKPDTESHKLPSYKAMIEKARTVEAVQMEDINTLFPDPTDDDNPYFDVALGRQLVAEAETKKKEATAPKVDPDTGEVVEAVEAAEDDGAWKRKIMLGENGKPQANFFNCHLLLLHEAKLKGLIWYNEFSDRIEHLKKRPWRDEDTSHVRKYLAETYGLNISKAEAQDAVELVGFESRSYHPVKEYLTSVNGTWDGISRAERLFLDYLGEMDCCYTREAALCWLMAACMRIWEPGYKFDYVPVLSGAQGIGKSTFCNVLAKKWFGELYSFEDQKAVEQMSLCWIMEIAEMTATNRHDIEEQKRFVSGRSSTVRLAYRRNPAEFKRHCVFIGTTNLDEYLKDSTGNRRWWPIHCRVNQIDTLKLRRETDQIWAEIMERCADPDATTELSREAYQIALSRQIESRVSDAWEGIINEWLATEAHKQRYAADWNDVRGMLPNSDEDMEKRDRVCVQEIWQDCLGGRRTDCKPIEQKRIAAIMNAFPHWERRSTIRFGERFGRQMGWVLHPEIAPF